MVIWFIKEHFPPSCAKAFRNLDPSELLVSSWIQLTESHYLSPIIGMVLSMESLILIDR